MKIMIHSLSVAIFVSAFLFSSLSVTVAAESSSKGTSSMVVDVAGVACTVSGKSREATLEEALADARQKGHDYVISLLKAREKQKKGAHKSELVSAYAKGTVRVVGEPKNKWFKDPAQGECCEVMVKVEAIPAGKEIATVIKKVSPADPSDPLVVKVWTDKSSYKDGEKFRVFIKSNKSFYGTVVYQDASGQKVQLLPNPYQKDNYFAGDKLYELPGAADKYDLIVTPPLGGEKITVFASTSPVGELSTEPAGKVYLVTGSQEQIANSTRSIRFAPRNNEPTSKNSAEFFEATTELVTVK